MKKERVLKKLNVIYILFAIIIVVLVLVIISLYLKSQGITGNAVTDSQVGNLSASIQTYVACTWSDEAMNISFGTNLDPGTNDINATKNFNDSEAVSLYNVTVSTLSNVNVDVTIKGADLESGANVIDVANVTWQSNNTSPNGTNMIASGSHPLGTTYDVVNKLADGLGEGNTAHFGLWLDVPDGQISGNYIGNFTQQCAEES
jgi:hypothetical protein